MSLEKTLLTAALAAPSVLIHPWASADEKHDHDHDHEHRQHGAHVHGIAALNLAFEGNEVQIELDSPAANIVGFEHVPSSADDQAALDEAVATLEDGDKLFRFNDEAGCRMETGTINSALLEDERRRHAEEGAESRAHDDKEGHDHDAHEGAHAHKDEHQHEQKEGHADDEHAHKGEHDHEHEGDTHSDIDAAYHFECDTPTKLTQLTVALFDAFAGMEKIEVQYVIETNQGAAELTAKDHVLKF